MRRPLPPPAAPPERPDDPRPLYQKLGEFIFRFSHIDWMLRTILGTNLKLPPELLDPVAASYDFLKLCDVTLATYRFCSTDPAATAEFVKLINRCKTLNNEYRVPIVHGLWFHMESEGRTVKDTGPHYATLHMTRGKLETKTHFDAAGDIDKGLNESALLVDELMASYSLITPSGSTPANGATGRGRGIDPS